MGLGSVNYVLGFQFMFNLFKGGGGMFFCSIFKGGIATWLNSTLKVWQWPLSAIFMFFKRGGCYDSRLTICLHINYTEIKQKNSFVI